ncbi:flippase [Candidatus Peregrinibacteria bacterium]|nr:flippase [Candidatus Peregrinibacteria bacterium]
MSTARKILSNTGYQVMGRAFTALLSIIIVKLLTNYLEPDGYGQYVTVYSYLAFFGVAADLGLFTIAVREMSKDENNIPFIIGNVLSLRTLLCVAMMIVAIITAAIIPKYDNTLIPLGVAIASLSTIFSILAGTISSVLQVHLKMQYSIFSLIIGRIVSFLYMLWIVLYAFKNDPHTGFIHLMIAGNINAAILLGLTYFYTSKFARISYRFDWIFWRDVLIKALPYGFALILSMIYFQIDSIILSLMKGTQEVGIYGVPMKMLEILNIVPVFFMNSVLPVLTRHIKDHSPKVKMILQYAFDFLVITALPMVVGAYLLAYQITFVIASPDFLSRISEGFYGSDIGIKILAFAMFFAYINSIFGFSLVALDRQVDLLKINACGVIFNIASNILVIPHWGFRGAAFMSIFSELLILILTSRAVHKYVDYRISLDRAFRALFSVGIMGLVIYFLREPFYDIMQNFLIVALIPLGAIVYIIMLIATKAVTKDMVALVRQK